MTDKLKFTTMIVTFVMSVIVISLIGIYFIPNNSSPSSTGGTDANLPPVSLYSQPTFDDLLDAIEWVESRGDANAVGDNGGAIEAVGAYQIHQIYLIDVNRILGKDKYSIYDRTNRNKSREIVTIYLNYYWDYLQSYRLNSKFWRDTKTVQEFRLECMARIHNGGPDGWRKESTKAYWQKVKVRLETK